MINHHYRTGKLAPVRDSRNLKLAAFTAALAPPPAQCAYDARVKSWPMFDNDTLGCCVEAAAGHMEEQWATYSEANFPPLTNADIVKFYSGAGKYVPGEPSTDNGTDMLTALKYWRNTGVASRKIHAFAEISGPMTLQQSIYLFGNAYIGLDLPMSAQNQASWVVDTSNPARAVPGTWGGHCVPVVAYAPDGLIVVTWGELLTMSWEFFLKYFDEAYAVLSMDWIGNQNKEAFNGFDFDKLNAALEQFPVAA